VDWQAPCIDCLWTITGRILTKSWRQSLQFLLSTAETDLIAIDLGLGRFGQQVLTALPTSMNQAQVGGTASALITATLPGATDRTAKFDDHNSSLSLSIHRD
jgi:hypothetical protein